jgi:hypothetical protein
VGQITEFVVTFCASTVPPLSCDTETEYAVAPEETFQVSVGVNVLTVGPGGELPPGDSPVGVGGVPEMVFTVK